MKIFFECSIGTERGKFHYFFLKPSLRMARMYAATTMKCSLMNVSTGKTVRFWFVTLKSIQSTNKCFCVCVQFKKYCYNIMINLNVVFLLPCFCYGRRFKKE